MVFVVIAYLSKPGRALVSEETGTSMYFTKKNWRASQKKSSKKFLKSVISSNINTKTLTSNASSVIDHDFNLPQRYEKNLRNLHLQVHSSSIWLSNFDRLQTDQSTNTKEILSTRYEGKRPLRTSVLLQSIDPRQFPLFDEDPPGYSKIYWKIS